MRIFNKFERADTAITTNNSLMAKFSTSSIPLVEKENLHSIHWPVQDVLKDTNSQHERMAMLHHATSLGNLDHHKVHIIFEDNEGIKRVNTTIWAITEKRIILKNNRTIPINRIHSVLIT